MNTISTIENKTRENKFSLSFSNLKNINFFDTYDTMKMTNKMLQNTYEVVLHNWKKSIF